jgi:hypothetical protein
MLDNTAVGQRAIVDNFGMAALPTLSWQIDPFGHSAFQGVLGSSLSGYDGQMWNREDALFKDECTLAKKAERVWAPSRSQPGVAAFQGTFVASGYGSPNNRCDGGSPTNGSGCGAQWAALDAVGLAIKVLYEYALAVRGSHVLLLFGTDFTTENAIIEGTPADDKGGCAWGGGESGSRAGSWHARACVACPSPPPVSPHAPLGAPLLSIPQTLPTSRR